MEILSIFKAKEISRVTRYLNAKCSLFDKRRKGYLSSFQYTTGKRRSSMLMASKMLCIAKIRFIN